MPKTKIKLKHCPFCKGEARISGLDVFWVFCTNAYGTGKGECPVFPSTTVYPTKEAAAEAWNRRSKL